jgi:hypothetical protein
MTMLVHLQRWDADEHYNDNMKTLSLHLMWFRHYRKVVWDEEAEEDLTIQAMLLSHPTGKALT